MKEARGSDWAEYVCSKQCRLCRTEAHKAVQVGPYTLARSISELQTRCAYAVVLSCAKNWLVVMSALRGEPLLSSILGCCYISKPALCMLHAPTFPAPFLRVGHNLLTDSRVISATLLLMSFGGTAYWIRICLETWGHICKPGSDPAATAPQPRRCSGRCSQLC
jgi:hypothetical protein